MTQQKTEFTVEGRIIGLVKIGHRWYVELESPGGHTPFDDDYAPLRVWDRAEITLSWNPSLSSS